MRALITCVILVSLSLFPTEFAFGQEKALPQLRQFTVEQRWGRLEQNYNVALIGGIGYAKSINQTAADLAQYFVKAFAPGWGKPNSGRPMDVFRGMRYNMISLPNCKYELIDSLEEKVVGRYSRWYVPAFKDNASLYGVSLDEFEGLIRAVQRGIAEYLGLRYEDRIEGDWVNFSMTKK
jgi:hypothetical protein